MPATLPVTDQDIAAIFRRRGVACTPQRQAIWRFFANHPRGYTIGEAAEALQGERIGQATVYRTVFLLLDMGLLCRIQDEPAGKAHFIAVRPGHTHPLVCRSCHQIVEFDSCDLSLLERLLASETGYIIERHHLEVYGLCPACRTEGQASGCAQ